MASDLPQSNVYVHQWSGGVWSPVGGRLTTGAATVQSFVDLQFNGATPTVSYIEQTPPTGEFLHVRQYVGAAWAEVGAPGARPACVAMFAAAMTLDGATPHLAYLGAGGCGIGAGYTYWTGATWWQTPAPPAPMVGLLTMNGGGTVDVAYQAMVPRALVTLMDAGSRYVRTWTPLPAPGAWTNLGLSLNVNPPVAAGPGGNALSMALDGTETPYVAFSESDGGQQSVFVKRYDVSTPSDWAVVGTGELSGAGSADFPSLAFVGGTPYVAWVEQTAGAGVIYVRRWTGSAWERVGGPLNNNVAVTASQPYLVGIGGVPYVAFREATGGAQRIFVKRFP